MVIYRREHASLGQSIITCFVAVSKAVHLSCIQFLSSGITGVYNWVSGMSARSADEKHCKILCAPLLNRFRVITRQPQSSGRYHYSLWCATESMALRCLYPFTNNCQSFSSRYDLPNLFGALPMRVAYAVLFNSLTIFMFDTCGYPRSRNCL